MTSVEAQLTSGEEADKPASFEQAIENEIRIVQSVQMQASIPILTIGSCLAFMNTILVSPRLAVSSKAIYLILFLVLPQVLMVRSYLRLRGLPRPAKVSKRRIRILNNFALMQGLVWAVIMVLMIARATPTETLLLLWVSYIIVFGGAILLPTMPRAALGYAGPVALASICAAIYYDLVDWIVPIYCAGGILSAAWAIRDNWIRTVNEVCLSVENVQAEAERSRMMERISTRLGKYMSPQLYKSVFSGAQKVEIASKRKKLTVFFSDIASFTEITRELESEELTALLNRYLTEMSAIALDHGGTIDKFIGDAMVVYFGDPETLGVKEDADQCVRMAMAMQARVAELQQEWLDMGLERTFELRIGINTGYCTVGNFGSEDRMDYTIIGSEVNLAARLETSADVGGILLANETHSLVSDWVDAEESAPVTAKGFAQPVRTFRVRGTRGGTIAATFEREREGLTVRLDPGKMGPKARSAATRALTEALEHLQRLEE